MVEKDSLLLVQRLWQRTVDRKLTWEATRQEKCYQTQLGDFRVQIALVFDHEYPDQPDYEVKIFNEAGTWIETITNSGLRAFMSVTYEGLNPYQLLEQTYLLAHRSALGVDKVVRTIIDLLGEP